MLFHSIKQHRCNFVLQYGAIQSSGPNCIWSSLRHSQDASLQERSKSTASEAEAYASLVISAKLLINNCILRYSRWHHPSISLSVLLSISVHRMSGHRADFHSISLKRDISAMLHFTDQTNVVGQQSWFVEDWKERKKKREKKRRFCHVRLKKKCFLLIGSLKQGRAST